MLSSSTFNSQLLKDFSYNFEVGNETTIWKGIHVTVPVFSNQEMTWLIKGHTIKSMAENPRNNHKYNTDNKSAEVITSFLRDEFCPTLSPENNENTDSSMLRD